MCEQGWGSPGPRTPKPGRGPLTCSASSLHLRQREASGRPAWNRGPCGSWGPPRGSTARAAPGLRASGSESMSIAWSERKPSSLPEPAPGAWELLAEEEGGLRGSRTAGRPGRGLGRTPRRPLRAGVHGALVCSGSSKRVCKLVSAHHPPSGVSPASLLAEWLSGRPSHSHSPSPQGLPSVPVCGKGPSSQDLGS